jgi:hypothetical protein
MRIALAACHTHSSSTVCERSFSKTNIVLSGSARARKLRGWEIASTEWIVFSAVFSQAIAKCPVIDDTPMQRRKKEERRIETSTGTSPRTKKHQQIMTPVLRKEDRMETSTGTKE